MQSVRVLVVASSPAFLRAAAQLLSCDARVAEVSTAQTAHAALGQLQTWQPDVVLLDLWLPDMNWLEATRQLKARLCAPRVVLMTMDSVDMYRDAAAAVQVDGVLDKTNFAREFGAVLNALPEKKHYAQRTQ
jgi:DNA-binding NarL/FixJ family response regulator